MSNREVLFLLTFHELAFPYQKALSSSKHLGHRVGKSAQALDLNSLDMIQSTCCVTLRKLLYLSEPPFPLQKYRSTVSFKWLF